MLDRADVADDGASLQRRADAFGDCRIGADRAAYAMVLFPVIALVLSTIFEGMTWQPAQLAGVALVLLGNTLVLLRIPKRVPAAVAPSTSS